MTAQRVSERWVRYWPSSEQPRERLLAQGPAALSDAELVAIFLRVGVRGMNVVDFSRKLLQEFGGLRGLFKASDEELRKVRGLGPAKIATLRAIGELSQRQLREKVEHESFIECSRDVVGLLAAKFRDLDREVFSIVFLNTKHRILKIEELFSGTIDSASVYPREVVKRALALSSSALIAVHNHPSGNPEPSREDQRLTTDLQQACKLVDVVVLDHIIIGGNDYFSFAEKNLM
ncbi:MAG: DNA repair protein RadC [Acidobacteriia bacterium]|nr:DNA repair protein RadC [Terriglobia bacterium]